MEDLNAKDPRVFSLIQCLYVPKTTCALANDGVAAGGFPDKLVKAEDVLGGFLAVIDQFSCIPTPG